MKKLKIKKANKKIHQKIIIKKKIKNDLLTTKFIIFKLF